MHEPVFPIDSKWGHQSDTQTSNNYKQHLKDDIPAGIVVFLVALPQCLGIAMASGAPLFSGLIAGKDGTPSGSIQQFPVGIGDGLSKCAVNPSMEA